MKRYFLDDINQCWICLDTETRQCSGNSYSDDLEYLNLGAVIKAMSAAYDYWKGLDIL